jgi:hypothetical protein
MRRSWMVAPPPLRLPLGGANQFPGGSCTRVQRLSRRTVSPTTWVRALVSPEMEISR